MIIMGNPAGSVSYWSKHLMRDDTNEKVEVKEITGLLAEDLPSALKEMQAIAAQSRSQGNFMYQANINPLADEHLTPEQWKEAVDTLEKNLGLEGHQRVVVEHVKHGRQHYHVVWNRVDVETLRVADMGGNWPIHEKTARELEARFGLSPTPSPANENTPEKKSAQELYEIRAAERSGIDPKAMKAELTELWQTADSGKAFAAAIEERGYILAKGDRRDFCVIDQAGDAHSLARRLDGVKAKDVRERMADIDRDALPSVAEARQTQRDHVRTAAEEKQPVAEPQKTPDAPRPQDVAKSFGDAQWHVSAGWSWNGAYEWRGVAANVVRAPAPEPSVEAEISAIVPLRTPAHEPSVKAEIAAIAPVELTDVAAKPVLAVVDAASGIAESLLDFVGGLMGSSKPPQQEFSSAASLRQIEAQREAIAALESIKKSIERGESLSASDIRHLTPIHLENIKLRGDDYLRGLIEGLQGDRAYELEYGRVRER
jgi:hypothetical protein